MQLDAFLLGAFIYLAAAVVAAPLAARFGLGSVLGYLVAGILIGPAVLGLVGSEGQDVLHFAEFGVIVMLFLVGLEVQPSKLWRGQDLNSGDEPPTWRLGGRSSRDDDDDPPLVGTGR